MINLILLIPKQVVLVSRRVVLLTAKILYFCAQMQDFYMKPLKNSIKSDTFKIRYTMCSVLNKLTKIEFNLWEEM
jgi:hypothetical protein